MATDGWLVERVDGPSPIAPPYGLLAAAEQPAAGVQIIPPEAGDGEPRWMNGVELYPFPPDVGDVYDPCGVGASPAVTKAFGGEGYEDFENPTFAAMTAYLPITCKTWQVPDQEQFKSRAVRVLGAVESYIIAREFMTGTRFPDNPNLGDGTGSFPNGDAATTPGYGLALLEEEIAKSGRQGLIHCSPLLCTMLSQWGFTLDNKTGVIRTRKGTVVIPDSGYWGGTQPDGHTTPSGAQWMFATGPIDIRRTEVFTTPDQVAQAVDRSVGATNHRPNTVTYRAERYYLIVWDTIVHASVAVDPCLTSC